MEIKATLKKPYNYKERANFVSKWINYEIKETSKELQAWGRTAEEQTEHEEEVAKINRINELEAYLSQTDWYAVRKADNGEEIPEEIRTARQDARDEISRLRGE
jgi:hypothetical protein